MKLVTYLVVALAVLTPSARLAHWVAPPTPESLRVHLVKALKWKSEWHAPFDESDPPSNLYQVARDKEDGLVGEGDPGDSPDVVMARAAPSVVVKPRPNGLGDVLRGVELYLDTEHSSGFVRVRDRVPHEMLEGLFSGLSIIGWHPIEDDECIEPHEFDDGTPGVKIWLYRLARPVEAILQDVKEEAIMRRAA